MRDPLWYAPISLAVAALGGAALVAALLVIDRRYFEPREVAIVAAVAGVALVVELAGVGGLAAWIARLPRPAAGDAVLAETYAGLGTHAVAAFLGIFGAGMPGLLAAWAIRGDVRVPGVLFGLAGGAALVLGGAWFGTAGGLVWVAREEGRVVVRRGLFEDARVPLADVLGIEVRVWVQGAQQWQAPFLRLRDGVEPASVALGTPSSLAAATKEADRVAAAAGLARLPDNDRRLAPAR